MTTGLRLMIGCVGDRFMAGVKESIAEAALWCGENRMHVEIKVQPSITITPFIGLATMRNRLCMMALEKGFDFLCLIDNDVFLSDKTALLEMTSYGRPILVPFLFQQYPKRVKTGEPEFSEKDSGLNKIQWQALSCILFNRNFLEFFNGEPFLDTHCYCEEETVFQRWRLRGYVAFRATDVAVTLLRPPTNLWEMNREELFRVKTPGDVPLGNLR